MHQLRGQVVCLRQKKTTGASSGKGTTRVLKSLPILTSSPGPISSMMSSACAELYSSFCPGPAEEMLPSGTGHSSLVMASQLGSETQKKLTHGLQEQNDFDKVKMWNVKLVNIVHVNWIIQWKRAWKESPGDTHTLPQTIIASTHRHLMIVLPPKAHYSPAVSTANETKCSYHKLTCLRKTMHSLMITITPRCPTHTRQGTTATRKSMSTFIAHLLMIHLAPSQRCGKGNAFPSPTT